MLSSLSEPAIKSLNRFALAFDIGTSSQREETELIEQVLEYMATHIQLRKLELIFLVTDDQELPAPSDIFNRGDDSTQWVHALVKNKGLRTLDIKVYDTHALEFVHTRMQWQQGLLSYLTPRMLEDTSVGQEINR